MSPATQLHPDRCIHIRRDGADVYAVVRLTRKAQRAPGYAFDDQTELCSTCTGRASAVICGFGMEAC